MLAGVTGSVLVVGGLIAPAAHAAGWGTTAHPTERTPHCAVWLAPEGSAESDPEQRCFERFADAVAHSTDGEVKLAADAGPSALDLDSRAVEASSLLGVLYDRNGYEGASQVLNGTGSGCYAGRTYAVNNLNTVGFEDRANSFKVRSNCLGRLYSDRDQDGATHLCEDNCTSLGNMKNRASSVKFF